MRKGCLWGRGRGKDNKYKTQINATEILVGPARNSSNARCP